MGLLVFFLLALCLHQSTTDEQQPIKTLLSVAEEFHSLVLADPSASTFESLVGYLEDFLEITQTEGDAEVVLWIHSDISEIFCKLVQSDVIVGELAQSSVGFAVVKEGVEMTFDRSVFPSFTALNSDCLEVRVTCIVSEFTSVGVIVYPEKTSPFKPLPNTNDKIVNFKVFDLLEVQVRDPAGSEIIACPAFFDVVTMVWTSSSKSVSMRVACAEWSDSLGGWSSEKCFSFANVSTPAHVVCRCDARNDRNVTEYIVYETEDDTKGAFEYALEVGEVKNSSDPGELSTTLALIQNAASSPKKMFSYLFLLVDHLPKIVSFEPDLLRNVTNGSLLADIGRVLEEVDLKNYDLMIGEANRFVCSFVFETTDYIYQPLVGFDLSTNRSPWMTYYRAGEVDVNKLFAGEVGYSLLFDDAVASQNARYGFIVYATDGYLTSVPAIGGRKVLTSRVVDVVSVPLLDGHLGKDQQLHMYFNPKLGSTEFGCARWVLDLAAWSENDCAVNPAFYRGVCTCAFLSGPTNKTTRWQFIAYHYQDLAFINMGSPDHEAFVDLEREASSSFALDNLRRYPRGERTAGKAVEMLNVTLEGFQPDLETNSTAFERLMNYTRDLWTEGECKTKLVDDNPSGLGVVCATPTSTGDTTAVVAFRFTTKQRDNVDTFTNDEAKTVETIISLDTVYAVRASASMATQNSRYLFIVLPMDYTLKPLPSCGRRVTNSRMVDVILTLRTDVTDGVEQFVEVYFGKLYSHTSLGCARWSEGLGTWTALGCEVFQVADNSAAVCNCSLDPNADHGRFLAYHYADTAFDLEVFARVASAGVVADAQVTFADGAALIHNASLLPDIDNDIIIDALQMYLRVLSVDASYLQVHVQEMRNIFGDICTAMSSYREGRPPNTASFGVFRSRTVDGAQTVQELASNMAFFVLSGDKSSDCSTPEGSHAATGFHLNFVNNVEVGNVTCGGSLPNRTVFACAVIQEIEAPSSLVFLVYPNNVSPFSVDTIARPVVNARQTDVFNRGESADLVLDLLYQPSEERNNYTQVGCAFWDAMLSRWVGDGCASNASTLMCRCKIAKGVDVASLVVYQYALNASVIFEANDLLVAFLVCTLLVFNRVTEFATWW